MRLGSREHFGSENGDCNLDLKKPHDKFGFHSDEIEKEPQYFDQVTKGRTVNQSPPESLKRIML